MDEFEDKVTVRLILTEDLIDGEAQPGREILTMRVNRCIAEDFGDRVLGLISGAVWQPR